MKRKLLNLTFVIVACVNAVVFIRLPNPQTVVVVVEQP